MANWWWKWPNLHGARRTEDITALLAACAAWREEDV
jgi:hypothetical protein